VAVGKPFFLNSIAGPSSIQTLLSLAILDALAQILAHPEAIFLLTVIRRMKYCPFASARKTATDFGERATVAPVSYSFLRKVCVSAEALALCVWQPEWELLLQEEQGGHSSTNLKRIVSRTHNFRGEALFGRRKKCDPVRVSFM